MSVALGVDTGGTYTDAVLVRDEAEIIASAKALTTREDLAIGIGKAVRAVLDRAGIAPNEVLLASLSTTLATNALVEGQGERVALIGIGFQAADLERQGLQRALNGDPAIIVDGGHTHSGVEAAPLDINAVNAFLEAEPAVSAYAVSAQFATRNPAHELEVARLVAERTGKPVTCSHQLSARLNGPKRALTAVLNARLIGLTTRLIGRTEHVLSETGIEAPLMVVRGDGALMSADQARNRPIETILSGPAASIVGAAWLTRKQDALVSDIGGTTTDIALIRGGKPAIDPAGALVGGHRTMVEAVAMRTHGLGGDSQVHPVTSGLTGGLVLGPRRVLPVSLIATEAPEIVHRALDDQLRASAPSEHDACFARALTRDSEAALPARETAILDRMDGGIRPLNEVLRSRLDHAALSRLVDRGHVQICGPTPSDASHLLGRQQSWDSEAARKALDLYARKRTGNGNRLAKDATDLAHKITYQLTKQTEIALLETVFEQEGAEFGQPPEQLARNDLLAAALRGHRGLLSLDASLNVDVVGLGASAATYYPEVGKRLRCRMHLPDHAEVANAIGAVVGRVTVRRSGSVTSPVEGTYRVHLDSGPRDFSKRDDALDCLETVLRAEAEAAVRLAGAGDAHHSVRRNLRVAQVEAREVFVEAELTVEVSGRPRVAGH